MDIEKLSLVHEEIPYISPTSEVQDTILEDVSSVVDIGGVYFTSDSELSESDIEAYLPKYYKLLEDGKVEIISPWDIKSFGKIFRRLRAEYEVSLEEIASQNNMSHVVLDFVGRGQLDEMLSINYKKRLVKDLIVCGRIKSFRESVSEDDAQ